MLPREKWRAVLTCASTIVEVVHGLRLQIAAAARDECDQCAERDREGGERAGPPSPADRARRARGQRRALAVTGILSRRIRLDDAGHVVSLGHALGRLARLRE